MHDYKASIKANCKEHKMMLLQSLRTGNPRRRQVYLSGKKKTFLELRNNKEKYNKHTDN